MRVWRRWVCRGLFVAAALDLFVAAALDLFGLGFVWVGFWLEFVWVGIWVGFALSCVFGYGGCGGCVVVAVGCWQRAVGYVDR